MESQGSDIEFSSSHPDSPGSDGSDTVLVGGHAGPEDPARGQQQPPQAAPSRKRTRAIESIDGYSSSSSSSSNNDGNNGGKDGDDGSSSSSSSDGADLEACIAEMVARRDQLRTRFKEWAQQVDSAAARLRSITDNALVNESMRLERILSDGKVRIDAIVADQNRIRDQLSSFVSMLSSAQSQIFGEGAPGADEDQHEPPARASARPARPGGRAADPAAKRPPRSRAAAKQGA
ncbi:hypothetical protein H4R18_002240 [Coemansia javaensis]|uniref:Uncharacterized protein n=1 Tax=Coemansia javaensis TaxID=2761396 RepID=A0A9W8HI68_9FUNG|nr:hypothetical protein H4R18_002240 [Coemansia javaensis]